MVVFRAHEQPTIRLEKDQIMEKTTVTLGIQHDVILYLETIKIAKYSTVYNRYFKEKGSE